MKFLVVALIALSVSQSLAQTPIPSKPDGYTYKGDASANVVLDVFIDLMCPDSRAIYPVMLQLADHYDPSDVQLNFHIFPLPYHHNSYLTAQGVVTVNESAGHKGVFQWFQAMFDAQDGFGNTPTANLTEVEIVAGLGGVATAAVSELSTDQWTAGLSDPSADWAARVSWKYACSKGVTGTPWWFINDVSIQGSLTYTASDWEKIIDPILAQDHAATEVTPLNMLEDGTCDDASATCEYLPGKIECCTATEACVPNVGCRC